MGIEKINKLEKAFCKIKNTFDDWQLEWIGDQNKSWDAEGVTPKGFKCVIEMKFRNKYYESKLLEKYKYDKLMELPKDVVKIYYVSDPKGEYYFWLDKLKDLELIKKNCPTTTLWNDRKVKKEVYLLNEDLASIINRPSESIFKEDFKTDYTNEKIRKLKRARNK